MAGALEHFDTGFRTFLAQHLDTLFQGPHRRAVQRSPDGVDRTQHIRQRLHQTHRRRYGSRQGARPQRVGQLDMDRQFADIVGIGEHQPRHVVTRGVTQLILFHIRVNLDHRVRRSGTRSEAGGADHVETRQTRSEHFRHRSADHRAKRKSSDMDELIILDQALNPVQHHLRQPIGGIGRAGIITGAKTWQISDDHLKPGSGQRLDIAAKMVPGAVPPMQHHQRLALTPNMPDHGPGAGQCLSDIGPAGDIGEPTLGIGLRLGDQRLHQPSPGCSLRV